LQPLGYSSTATEAGAIGVVASLVVAVSRRQLSQALLLKALLFSVHATAQIRFIAQDAIPLTHLKS
jgi:TRAP-type mannitol/chloroaromatic compound transport system permease large subunit